jgi:hypothetical protein
MSTDIPKKLKGHFTKERWNALTPKQQQNWIDAANEKHTIVSVCKTSKKYSDETGRFMITYRNDGERGGYETNDVDVSFGKDGHIHFCGEDPETHQVFLYPEQVKHLKKLLKEMK